MINAGSSFVASAPVNIGEQSEARHCEQSEARHCEQSEAKKTAELIGPAVIKKKFDSL